jgi:HEPN domain-containing protein
MKPSTKMWVSKADGDRRVAIKEMGSGDPVYDAVCFHAQQCVEKYLKAALEEAGVSSPKSHDLLLLYEKTKGIYPDLELNRDELATLSFYSVDVRYPGGVADPEDAREAIAIMESALKRLKKCFPLK